MIRILNLETATTNCSVSAFENMDLALLKENNAQSYSHSEQLHVFIQEVMSELGWSFSQLDAVAISKGPGSYTGLRIGVSAAKGLCFSVDVPLISVPTLQSMATQVSVGDHEVVIPVLDARRMEVYSAVYDENHEEIRETRAEIIDENSFSDFQDYNKVWVVGNGAEKCQDILGHNPSFTFDTHLVPSAKEMGPLALAKFKAEAFEDVAYFEPYYLKDFVLQGKK
ncbi:MAG: tRNA (adenosine(37)-N6)-threonylcarbamoyltransferase complex dimerization subunit type 1 TsaB [Bacteroidota bacterium]